MGRLRSWAPVAALAVCWATQALAGRMGLRTEMGEMRLDGVTVGKPHNLRARGNLRYVLENEGDAPVEAAITVLQPEPKVLREGYESIPDPSWIRIIPDRTLLPVGGGTRSEIIVAVPDDPRWIGRRYQASIMSATRGTGMISAAVRSYLLISTDGPEPGARVVEIPDFSLEPNLLMVDPEAKEGRPLRVVNKSKTKLKIVFSVDVSGPLGVPKGYEPLPPSARAKISPKSLKLKPGEQGDYKLEIRLPPQERGKRHAVFVKARVEGYPVEVEQYVTALIEARKEMEERR